MSQLFPDRLHQILHDAEQSEKTDIISWQPHGRAFQIHDKDAFMTTILPAYFRHSSFASFKKQLHNYGFLCLRGKGPDMGAYYHKYFLRNNPELSKNMKRIVTTCTKRGPKAHNRPATEPDLHNMEPVSTVFVASGESSTQGSTPTALDCVLGDLRKVKAELENDYKRPSTGLPEMVGDMASGAARGKCIMKEEGHYNDSYDHNLDDHADGVAAGVNQNMHAATLQASPPSNVHGDGTGSVFPDELATLAVDQFRSLAESIPVAAELVQDVDFDDSKQR